MIGSEFERHQKVVSIIVLLYSSFPKRPRMVLIVIMGDSKSASKGIIKNDNFVNLERISAVTLGKDPCRDFNKLLLGKIENTEKRIL